MIWANRGGVPKVGTASSSFSNDEPVPDADGRIVNSKSSWSIGDRFVMNDKYSKSKFSPRFFYILLIFSIGLLLASCGGPSSATQKLPSPAPENEATEGAHVAGEVVASPGINKEDFLSAIKSGEKDITFETISLDQGLSQSVVSSILQDQDGFMWFGTQDGLNRFDGYDFKVYKNDPDNPYSLGYNLINSLIEDSAGIIWIGTQGGGLQRFDSERQEFIQFLNDPDDPASLSGDIVSSLYIDQQGDLWVGTIGAGLNRFDQASNSFTRYQNDPSDSTSIGGNNVQSIVEDRDGNLWIGTTDGGLNQYIRQSGQFTRYQTDPDNPNSLSINSVQVLYFDRDQNLWIGTNGGGLNRFDLDTRQFTRYPNDPSDADGLSFDTVFSLFQDSSGLLWVGTNGGGLDLFDPENETFIHYINDPNDPESLSNNQVWSIYEDRGGVLWFGTFGGGVNKYDPYQQKFTSYFYDPDHPEGLNNDQVWSVVEGEEGVLWIGTNGGGLNRFDRETGEWRYYLNDPNDPNSLSHNAVFKVYQDREGIFWIGTGGGGLNRFDPDTGEFEQYDSSPFILSLYEDRDGQLWIGTIGTGLGKMNRETGDIQYYQFDPNDPYSLSDNTISFILEDSQGEFWVGTLNGGFNLFDRETERFTRYQNNPADPNSLSQNTTISVLEASDGTLWIGTGGGLNKFNRETGLLTDYREEDGLPNDVIYAMLEDDHGYLWLSTNKGIAKFDPRTDAVKSYSVKDGLQSNEFNQGAYDKNSQGEMFFGGVKGLTYFHPDKVVDNAYIPPVLITNFLLFNESLDVGDDSPLQKPIEKTSDINLSYQDDFFGFEFAALHYASPENIQYAYKMEGLDKVWNLVGNRRFANYTNVPPGDYTFMVKGTNSDGVWNELGTSLQIMIPPPFWQTWWFRIAVAMILVGGATGAFYWRVRAIEKQRQQLEIQVDERTKELRETLEELGRSKEAAEAANRAKSVFLANMSHEFRTPLNAILGFTQLMTREKDMNPGLRENLEIIHRSSEHLLGLINDVLELSKIEAGRTTLKEQNFDLHRMLEGLEDMFRLRAENKGLSLRLELSQEVPRYVHMDEGKLRQVLMNLLGNAVKFTKDGYVILDVSTVESKRSSDQGLNWLRFAVEDTGPGVPEEEMSALFDPFVQTTTGQLSQEGTGLGLPISQQYVRLMGGVISVNSQVGKGSIFEFETPARVISVEAIRRTRMARRVIGLEPGQSTCRMLVVDDQELNRKLLVKLFVPVGFEVREAANGKEAIEIWEDWEPHLIWMDMRMPVMDGYEATRRIKATTKGQATVIIALTASGLEEDRAVILSEGCDDYMRKPFHESELYEAIAKHLGVRYIYQDAIPAGEMVTTEEIEPSGKVAPKETDADLVKQLAAMPDDWRNSLEQATILGDLDSIGELIQQASLNDPLIFSGLKKLADNFEHDHILNLIQRASVTEKDDEPEKI